MKDRLVFGIGVIGIGRYKSTVNGIPTKSYIVWHSMLERCYYAKLHARFPSYIGCSVDESWLNYQVFAQWFEDNYIKGFFLDKDILIKGNKIYSPDTCCFVPHEINSLLQSGRTKKSGLPIGVSRRNKRFVSQILINGKFIHLGTFNTPELAFDIYSEAKINHIRDIIFKYKDLVTPQTYEALYNYKI